MNVEAEPVNNKIVWVTYGFLWGVNGKGKVGRVCYLVLTEFTASSVNSNTFIPSPKVTKSMKI